MPREINIQELVDSLITTPISKKTVEQYITEREGLYNKYYEIYGKTIGWLSITYVIFICIIVILGGFSKYDGFHLSDEVIITLLCSTASSILGLMYIVANHLFPKNRYSHIENSKSTYRHSDNISLKESN